jgi:riboflavin synthase
MFTGIVEELGRVRAVTPNEVGSSIAVNGCCLTVVSLGDGWWTADAQRETLARTTLGSLRGGDPVNLERPVRLADRLGGHLVQGHVDAVGTVTSRESLPDGSTLLTVGLPGPLARYVVEKGSVTVDGVSLTVTSVDQGSFGVALIPHTLAVTTLGTRGPGDEVNLEVDVLAKYVERLLVVGTTEITHQP